MRGRIKTFWMICQNAIQYCKTMLLSNRGNIAVNATPCAPVNENRCLPPFMMNATDLINDGHDFSITGNVVAVDTTETRTPPYININTYWKRTWYTHFYQWMSRMIDIIIASCGLILFLPFFCLLSIIIKFESPGPVLYKQMRVGLNRRAYNEFFYNRHERRERDLSGKLFTIYKLRTMSNNAERDTGPVWAREKDNRVTHIGKLLRLMRLDEIPQFFNVLKNDMGMIGPRPERPEFVLDLAKKIPDFCKRHNVKPGITGLAQIKYHYASSLNDTKHKTKYDLLYLKKKSLRTDLYILLNTLPTVLLGKGAR
jgi:lipopolysaccharide/colanic/teichoic acid biosynthesis glycosyltransferase